MVSKEKQEKFIKQEEIKLKNSNLILKKNEIMLSEKNKELQQIIKLTTQKKELSEQLTKHNLEISENEKALTLINKDKNDCPPEYNKFFDNPFIVSLPFFNFSMSILR